MKVCILASAFRPYATGGADVAVENTVDGLLAQGHDVMVITAGFFESLSSFFPRPVAITVPHGRLLVYRYYPMNFFSFLTINQRPAWLRLPWHIVDTFNIHAYVVTVLILRREKPIVVLTHNMKGIGYLSIRAVEQYARRSRTRHIHTLHDVQLAIPTGRIIKGEENSWQNRGLLTRMYEKLNRRLFASPAVVVSASQFLLDFYEKRKFFPHSRKVILLNPLRAVTPAVYNQSDKDGNHLSLLYLGQLEKHKGIIFLIQTFKELLCLYPNRTRLRIVGGGMLWGDIRKLAAGYPEIEVRGAVAHRALPSVFSYIDATVFPSLCYENSPTIIGESLSFGVPVIAAQIGGVQLVQHGVNGYTFQAGDKTDLLRTLEHCLTHKDELLRLRVHTIPSVRGLDINSYLTTLLGL